jgi:hypothetical protein
MSKRVQERPDKRTSHSKTFEVSEGKFRTVVRARPQHFFDAGSWKEISTQIVERGNKLVCDSQTFKVEFLPGGFRMVLGGTRVTMKLVAANGSPVELNEATMIRETDTVWFIDGVPLVDIGFKVTRSGVRTIKRLKSALAPKSFTWEVTETGLNGLKFHAPVGRDNESGAESERRNIEIQSQRSTPSGNGNRVSEITETWTGNVFTRNPETRVLELTTDPVYPVTMDPTVGPIASASDDGDETSGTWTDRYYRWYTGRTGGTPRHGGVRFLSIAVPQGATITSATLTTGEVENSYQLPANTVISADDVDNAPTWDNSSKPSSGYTPTTATVFKAFSETSGRVALTVTSIVQEIVDRPGWVSGNAMRFAFKNDGTGNANGNLSFDAHDAADSESSLSIDYSVASPVKTLAALGVG